MKCDFERGAFDYILNRVEGWIKKSSNIFIILIKLK